ncbi:MAG: helix-turn-helix transcriptional regulator [Acidobacteria bacterium]|nr:helix-turn-helix transcriptional regulator [Acidobacteriota bacterium]
MAKNIDDIIRSLPIARRRRIERRAEELIGEEMTLRKLRLAQKMTQAELAKALGIAQKQISKIEGRTDMHLSTLRRQVEAMGGSLELIARFPNRAPVTLTELVTETGRVSKLRAQSTSGKAIKSKLRA